MPIANAEGSALLAAGLRDDFWDTWDKTYTGIEEMLKPIAEFVPSDKLEETYGFAESAPHARRWREGQPAVWEGFGSDSFSVKNKDWVVGVGWNRNQVDDDQTRSLKRRARSAGRNFGLLHERIIFQILLAATDPELLESVPVAPSGTALFSSSTRYGASGGNIVSGGGVASTAAVQTDLFKARARVRAFQDTKGQPLWAPSIADMDTIIIFGSDNEEVFRSAFYAETIHSVVSSTGAAVTNIVKQSGVNYTLIATPRITDNDWFVAFPDTPVKPFIVQERQSIREVEWTMENDREASRTKNEGIQWDARYGYGLNEPYGLIKVDN